MGVEDKLSRITPTRSRTGVSVYPLLHRGPVRPKNVPENKKVCVRARCGLRGSLERVGIACEAVWARKSAYRGRI